MSPAVNPSMSPSCQRPGNFPSPDPPSQSSSGEPPILSPHNLHQSFFSSMLPKPPPQHQQQGTPPPTTPTTKSISNASILERALGTNVKQEHHVVSQTLMATVPGQVQLLATQF